MKTKFLIILTGLLFFTACAPTSEFEKQKKEWQSQGWTFSEIVGEKTDQAEYVSHMSSPTARSVNAFANNGQKLEEKEFSQSEDLFLIVTMADQSGKTYAIIFKKKKGA